MPTFLNAETASQFFLFHVISVIRYFKGSIDSVYFFVITGNSGEVVRLKKFENLAVCQSGRERIEGIYCNIMLMQDGANTYNLARPLRQSPLDGKLATRKAHHKKFVTRKVQYTEVRHTKNLP